MREKFEKNTLMEVFSYASGQPKGRPPNNVIIDLHGKKNQAHENNEAILEIIKSAKIYDIDGFKKENSVLKSTLNCIKEHICRFGKVDEIWLSGHGRNGFMLGDRPDGMNDEAVSIDDILIGISKLRDELGPDICKRIVFNGCKTFSDMDALDVKRFSILAHKMGIEIVGTTTSLISGGWGGFIPTENEARYIQFSPNGKVIRDKLDDPYAFIKTLGIAGMEKNWVEEVINKEINLTVPGIPKTSSLINLSKISQ